MAAIRASTSSVASGSTRFGSAYTKERPVRLTKTVFPGDPNRLVYELGQLEALYDQDAP
jgi:hypothetical protein